MMAVRSRALFAGIVLLSGAAANAKRISHSRLARIAGIPPSGWSKQEWKIQMAWGPHRALLNNLIDALFLGGVDCSPCPNVNFSTWSGDYRGLLAKEKHCAAICFPWAPSEYDFRQSTEEAYVENEENPAMIDDGEFAPDSNHALFEAPRSKLDPGWHKPYTLVRQVFQEEWMRRVHQRVWSNNERPWAVFTAGAMGVGKGHVMRWLNQQGIFSVENIAHVDPDYFKSIMPEWNMYKKMAADTGENSGTLCHKESAAMEEMLADSCINSGRSFWEDGSLSDAHFFETVVFKKIRESVGHLPYKIALIHIRADSPEQVLRQARNRIDRQIKDELVMRSLEKSDRAVEALRDKVDFFAEIVNVPDRDPSLVRTWWRDGNSSGQHKPGLWSDLDERFGAVSAGRGWESQDTKLEKMSFDKLDAVFPKYLNGLDKQGFLALARDVRNDLEMFPVALERVFDSFGDRPTNGMHVS